MEEVGLLRYAEEDLEGAAFQAEKREQAKT